MYCTTLQMADGMLMACCSIFNLLDMSHGLYMYCTAVQTPIFHLLYIPHSVYIIYTVGADQLQLFYLYLMCRVVIVCGA